MDHESLGLCVHHDGTPDAIALVEGDDIATMDAVIDQLVEIPEVLATDSKVARWIE